MKKLFYAILLFPIFLSAHPASGQQMKQTPGIVKPSPSPLPINDLEKVDLIVLRAEKSRLSGIQEKLEKRNPIKRKRAERFQVEAEESDRLLEIIKTRIQKVDAAISSKKAEWPGDLK